MQQFFYLMKYWLLCLASSLNNNLIFTHFLIYPHEVKRMNFQSVRYALNCIKFRIA